MSSSWPICPQKAFLQKSFFAAVGIFYSPGSISNYKAGDSQYRLDLV